MPELDKLTLSDMIRVGSELRKIPASLNCMESAAEHVVDYFYENFRNGTTGSRNCVLVRFYLTVPFGELEPDLQLFASTISDCGSLRASTKCMTLLATRGDDPAWNSRISSVGHKAIPLPSVDVVSKMPMMYQLVRQLGIELSDFLDPTPELFLEMEQRNYNVFHVPTALNSPHIPAQDNFVVPFGIRSVLGFGGLLPGGELFAVILFARDEIPLESAQMFKTVALNIKTAILKFSVERKIFSR
ncbi:MAG: hypothetical protein HUU46_20885 [Candidatus Hydrogenedentes bacterium]|nr:hypothetical protein [Candidatus Hydrogenedentota bacterium]